MIERYTLTTSAQILQDRFQIEVPEFYQPLYNAAPTRLLPLITQTGINGISWFYWGMVPEWAHNKSLPEKLINVRVESFPEKSSLMRALRKNRCLIPADGFYAWKRTGKKTLVPYRFTFEDPAVAGLAGIWEEFDDTDGKTHHTFSIITCPAPYPWNSMTDRIPFLLSQENERRWLTGTEEEAGRILQDQPKTGLTYYPVSPRIADSTLDTPSLIKATPPSDQFGNLTLFD